MSKILTIVTVIFVLLPFSLYYAQQKPVDEGYKTAALTHMKAGRYGEAIDLLNKYISANPRLPEGYYLRAQSYDKRSQYSHAVLDYRRARNLAAEKGDEKLRRDIQRDLDNVLKIWHDLLYKKIEGHKREIAIDPSNPFNYLEIGKSYRYLEIWDKAEEWYDEYLKRDDNASPDEIIRYTEILAKTGSIRKGERILKKYTDRYPEDWRLWSRYGYFLLWLSKYAQAKTAFENALSFKPFFKEAQDGLDIATRKAYVTQYDPRAFEREYPIDRYYRLLRRNPENLDMRFNLVDELIKADRMEEAYQQLQLIGIDHSDDPRYQEKYDYVTNYRNEVYREKIDEYKARLENNPSDIEAAKNVAKYYEYLQEYDNATAVLDKFFENNPNETDKEIRFQYARINAWNRDFDKAIVLTDELLKEYPNDLDYQLFRAQVSVWTDRDFDLAREYLENVLANRPNNVDALISMGSLNVKERNFDVAQQFADKAKNLDPTNDEVVKLQSNIDFERLRAEEEGLYKILEQGRELVIDGNCEDALPYYVEYLDKAEPNNLILKEYGDVLFCAKDYDKAASTYDEVLSYGYDFETALQRAKVAYAQDDTAFAVDAFEKLVREEPEEFEPRLYLGDTYMKEKEYSMARAQYDTLETLPLDSTQTAMIELRKSWLPVTGLGAIFETFPNYIGFAPSLLFYSDNLSFRIYQAGGRLELGVTSWLSIGASFVKSTLQANSASLDQDVIGNIPFSGSRKFTTFKGFVNIRLSDQFTFGTGFGRVNSEGQFSREETNAYMNFEEKKKFRLNLTYLNTDAALILYSPYLQDVRLFATYYKLEGYYQHPKGMRFSGHFNYLSITDGNEGNDFELRIGRRFYDYLYAGYEYYYTNYKFDADLYYSPANFESHSLWVDSYLEDKEDLQVKMGGKIGFIPNNDLLSLGAYVEAFFKAMDNLQIQGRLAIGSTSRDNSSYKYVSGQISAYWTIR